MTDLLNYFLNFVLGLGLAGVFVIAVLDSTFLFYMPFAIDWLFIILVSNNPSWMLFYVVITSSGSVLGSWLTYQVISKTSEHTLEQKLSKKKLDAIQAQLKQKGFAAMILSSFLPPPFPFTPFIVAASAAKMPLKKLLSAVLLGRFGRFCAEGLLVLMVGKRLLRLLDSTGFKAFMFGLFVLALIGSSLSIWRWMHSSPSRTEPSRA